MTKTKKYCIISIVIIFAVSAMVWTVFEYSGEKNDSAEISVEGKHYGTVSLGTPAEFTVRTKYGYNKIRVSDGKIGITDADCRDKLCVHAGFIGKGGIPIICLPHRLEIRTYLSKNKYDVAAR